MQLKKFVHEGKLVHGDLSNYNILNQNEEPIIIDVSQSVVLDKSIFMNCFKRDIKNIS